ncbi:MAG: sulfotransferase [Pseudomonadota bacterium]|nr:sulfotransferase [Pseudomonadota bacterium]
MAQPNAAAIKAAYATALKQQNAGQFGAAFKAYEAIVQAAPRLAEAHYQMGRVALELYRPRTAVAALTKAARLKSNVPEILRAKAEAEVAASDQAQALKTLGKLVSLRPNDPAPKVEQAKVLQQLGRFDEALEIIGKLLKKQPEDGQLYRLLTFPRRMQADDPVIPQMQALWEQPLSDQSRIDLGYALAKTMGDLGQHDQVFTYLDVANALQCKQAAPNMDGVEEEAAQLITAQQGAKLPALAAPQSPSPIFITGMPRSGTTLVERIFGRHPQVGMAEEIAAGFRLARATLGNNPKAMAPLSQAKPEMLSAVAQRMRVSLAETSSQQGAKFVTDKSIMTYLVMPALAAAMPDARFVVVRRDPRDVALSIYRNHFADGTHRYSTDLEAIARQIVVFERCIDAFRDTLGDRMIEVRYEDLVDDPDTQIPRLITGAGLDWNDACLHPEDAEGAVRTLSLGQVRAPVYKSSKGGWRRFETEMQPFIKTYEALTHVPFRD